MTTMTLNEWQIENQRALVAALAEVRSALEGYAGVTPSRPDLPTQERGETEVALNALCTKFGLSAFERAVLMLCAGIELDGAFAELCAAAHNDPAMRYPTWSLALTALPEPHWSALTPQAPLRRWRLIEVDAGGSLTTSRLRIDECVLHYLTGIPQPDERLNGYLEPLRGVDELPPSHEILARRIAAAWVNATGAAMPLIQLCGGDGAAKQAITAAACVALGLRFSVINGKALPTAPVELEGLIRLWERDAALTNSALLLDCDDLDPADALRERAITRVITQLAGPLIVTTRDRRAWQRGAVTFDVPQPTRSEQRALWHGVLGEAATTLNGHVDGLIAQFNLGASAIRAVVEELGAGERGLAMETTDPQPVNSQALWDACRMAARPRLDELAQRIEPTATWDDLVLPKATAALLHEIAAHVRQRATVYGEWGFGAQSARGLGISALFAGDSGTGKTMAAEVLAQELQLDLYRIDLATVVSKYIGETEKNLRRVFDAAEGGGAILLFDEADALFGKRSEVKDSHDRYANIEVSYLLQRMENYRGLAILTTNQRSALDQAFLRRLRFMVQFPFPDSVQRAAIWQRIFPPATPTVDLDCNKLARLNIAGGNIRNIALNAAFLAADAGEPVRMPHLRRAAQTEYAKLEKPLTETETAGW